jgi:acyl carrier protein
MSNHLETEEIFLSFVEDTLELTTGILSKNIDMNLDGIEEWDSLSIMSFVSLIDVEFNIEVDADVLISCKTPSELFKLTNKLLK